MGDPDVTLFHGTGASRLRTLRLLGARIRLGNNPDTPLLDLGTQVIACCWRIGDLRS